jgi:nucleoside-diphosphate-sugar epimerase
MDNCLISASDKILVTGSNGFIGTKVVECLLQNGVSNIRCFARPSSHLERLRTVLKQFPNASNVELIQGDLLSREDCNSAAQGVSVIVHLAAGFQKSFSAVLNNSVMATRNLLDAFLECGTPLRFVHVSSFAVYSNLKMRRGEALDESSPLEDAPQDRHDAYCFGKLSQEKLLMEYNQRRGLPYVILRPGAVFGPGKADLTGRIGIRAPGLMIHVGGSNQLPLTYVDNCAEAITLATLKKGVDGEVFNVVDDNLLTSRQFLDAYRKRRRLLNIPIPYFAAYSFCALCEYGSRYLKLFPTRFNRRRCAADWKGNRFSNRKLRQRLGWKPRVPMDQAMRNFLAQFEPVDEQKIPCENQRFSALRSATSKTL